ncbi:MAG: HlyD family efflux transporter periplasmic adaptor subunit [Planctomycetes bacterium]|nr:HlyD family efflux transporter periplasmic adaptor subunit [Planctomycetota bacterium]
MVAVARLRAIAAGAGLFVTLAGVAVGVAGCGGDRDPAAMDGIVELERHALGFELPGRVAAILVERGARVTLGQPLARLDDSLERAQRPAAAAEVELAEARLRLLETGARESEIKALEARLYTAAAALEGAERDLARQRPLLEKGTVGQATIDRLTTGVDEARGARDALLAQLRTAREGSRPEEIAAARAARDAAAARLAALDERLKHYTMRAPDEGEIADLVARVGEVLPAGGPVALFVQARRPYADLFVPAPRLVAIAVGAKAAVRADGDEREYAAVVEQVSPITEYTPRYLLSDDDRAALVTRVRVRIADPEQRLHAGVPCRVVVGK